MILLLLGESLATSFLNQSKIRPNYDILARIFLCLALASCNLLQQSSDWFIVLTVCVCVCVCVVIGQVIIILLWITLVLVL